jgi:hypothetical protein
MFKGLTARRLYKSFGVKGLTIPTYIHNAKLLIGATSLDIPLFLCNVHQQVACEDRVSSLMMALVRRNMQDHLP